MGLARSNGVIQSADTDEQFFMAHPDRQAHIRMPRLVPMLDNARRMHMVEECFGEFRSLGEHDKRRRRILLWRIPADRWGMIPNHDGHTQVIMKVPFLAYSDETIEDNDETFVPIFDEIMKGELPYAASQ